MFHKQKRAFNQKTQKSNMCKHVYNLGEHTGILKRDRVFSVADGWAADIHGWSRVDDWAEQGIDKRSFAGTWWAEKTNVDIAPSGVAKSIRVLQVPEDKHKQLKSKDAMQHAP